MVLNNSQMFRFRYDVEEENEMTRLTLGPPPLAQQNIRPNNTPARRRIGNQHQPGKETAVPALYPWSEPRRATVSSLETLATRGVSEVRGTLQCKRCERQFEVSHDARAGFRRVAEAISARKQEFRDRAPAEWMYPTLPRCRECGEENSARPVFAEKKRDINWLFLFLSGLLGCCTLEQLKYFCKHTGNHRTGAKDRVLYLAYLAICNQLLPHELFDPHHR